CAGRGCRVHGAVISSGFPLHRDFSRNAAVVAESDNRNIFFSRCPSAKEHAFGLRFCALRDKSIFRRWSFRWHELGPLRAIFLFVLSKRLPGRNALRLRKASTGKDSCRLIPLRRPLERSSAVEQNRVRCWYPPLIPIGFLHAPAG